MYRGGRPYFRSSLARAVYDRMQLDDELRNLNKDTWYHCNLNALSQSLCETFVLLNCDQTTQSFLDMCHEKSDWVFTQIFHSVVRTLLSWFMTQTSINSWLRRGSMFVFSGPQFLSLLGVNESWKAASLLDLGAGDGNVTSVMAPYFHDVYVTEMSAGMCSLLAEKGYKVLDVGSWADGSTQFDVITLLNILDRCSHPLSMLTQAKEKLRPHTGRLVIALALPFTPYVEVGPADHLPREKLTVAGSTFEEQVVNLQEVLFTPLGLAVERWSRLPYFSEGDLSQSFYWLFDAVFVLRPVT